MGKDYTYDLLGRETTVSQHGTNGGHSMAEKRVDHAYNLAGQYKTVTRYANTAGTQLVAASNYTYDAAGRLTNLAHKRVTTTLADYTWSYDATSRLKTFTNATHTGENAVYDYDPAGQVTSGAKKAGQARLLSQPESHPQRGQRTHGNQLGQHVCRRGCGRQHDLDSQADHLDGGLRPEIRRLEPAGRG